jgi:Zn-dependent protease
MPTRKGSFKLFTLFGIGVYVHWMWFLVAAYSIEYRTHEYTSMMWNVAEYLALFLIVLIHEFGHQLACRSVGGQTHDIVLWPLGGVAFVTPPQRPGAQLWSIAAGPLVNVVLVPILTGFVLLGTRLGWPETHPDLQEFFRNVCLINIVLLVFNMMPVYPLDGGQILRSLLWFPFGRANSLFVATIIGFIGVAGLVLLAILGRSIWLGIMAGFILMNCWGGLRQAQALSKIAKLPRRDGFACPSCKMRPPLGELWRCGKCGQPFDTFLAHAMCPHCGTQYNVTQCLDCGTSSPFSAWVTDPPPPPV